MTKTHQINFRPSDKTLAQLEHLGRLWDNKTTALSIAIDRAYREETECIRLPKQQQEPPREEQ